MRCRILASLLMLLPFAAAGCSEGPSEEPEKDKPPIASKMELDAEKQRVLDLLRKFEEHDLGEMDRAVAELEEISRTEKYLISEEIAGQLERYHSRATVDSAVERLRWLSKFARTIGLLSRNTKEDWEHCRDVMLRLGPEAVVRFTAVLMVEYATNPAWIRPMLMDLCVAQPAIVPDAILSALQYAGTTQPGAMKVRVLDSNALGGLASALVFLPDPPVTKIRESAVSSPLATRVAWASVLAKPKSKDGKTGVETSQPWAVELLGVMLLTDRDWQVRLPVALELGETNDPDRSIPPLTKALKDKDPMVRRNTCRALSRYGAKAQSAVGPIIDMLKALDTETVEVVEDGQKVNKPFGGGVRKDLEDSALVALKSLTGKPFREINSFFAWWEENRR